jgi:hypothetical protein
MPGIKNGSLEMDGDIIIMEKGVELGSDYF